jgi:opacity protein-like surface antigen
LARRDNAAVTSRYNAAVLFHSSKLMLLKFVPIALSAALLAPVARAQVGISADIGTTGAGLHLVVPLKAALNGRIGVNYMHHEFVEKSGSVDYDVKGKLQTIDLLLDYYPRDNSVLRLTAGIVYNGNHFDAYAADKSGTLTANGRQYRMADAGVVHGDIDFRKAAPYVGIGWGNALALEKRWNFSLDLGAFYQGKGNVRLESSGCTASRLVCDALASDLAAERAQFASDIDSNKVYPVLRGSVSYRF